jgi:hypothetical protein
MLLVFIALLLTFVFAKLIGFATEDTLRPVPALTARLTDDCVEPDQIAFATAALSLNTRE